VLLALKLYRGIEMFMLILLFLFSLRSVLVVRQEQMDKPDAGWLDVVVVTEYTVSYLFVCECFSLTFVYNF